MPRKLLDRYILACLLLDTVAVLVALLFAELLRATLPYGRQLENRAYVTPAVYLIALACWFVSSFHFRLYEWRWTVTWRGEAARLLLSLAGFLLLLAAMLYLTFRDVPRLLFAYYALLALGSVLLVHVLIRRLSTTLPRQRVVVRIAIVGTSRIAAVLAARIASRVHPWPPTEIVGFISTHPTATQGDLPLTPLLGGASELTRLVTRHRITTVLLALPPEEHATALEVAQALEPLAIDVRLLPDVLALASARATIEYVEGMPLLGLRDPALTLPSRLVKYGFDRVASLIGLIVTSPLWLLIALAIRLDSPGPIFYHAARIGERGKQFTMLKFRTMQPGADQQLQDALGQEALSRGDFKLPDDPRVTRVGRILRRTSLDELPQLINILRGEMSIVGPRPEQPFITAQYAAWQHRRTELRPGLTGWWQVNGRSENPLHKNTDFDLYYLENYSFWLDLRILGRTVVAIVRGRGAF